MKRTYKIILWTAFLFLMAGFVVIPLVLRTDYAQERLAQIAKTATQDLPVSVSFSRIMPDMLSRITISDLKISSGKEVILQADRLSVGPLLPGILGEERSLGRVLLVNPKASLVRDSQGIWNASSWFVTTPGDDSGKPLELSRFPRYHLAGSHTKRRGRD